MEGYAVGKRVPDSLYQYLSKASGDRAFCNAGKHGIDFYVVLNGISKDEEEAFKGTLTLILQEYDIPFLTLDYGSFSFNMPVIANGEKLGGNVAMIYIIEEDGDEYILKGLRTIGIDWKIIDAINKAWQKIEGLRDNEILSIVEKCYARYSPQKMAKGGLRQIFERKEN